MTTTSITLDEAMSQSSEKESGANKHSLKKKASGRSYDGFRGALEDVRNGRIRRFNSEALEEEIKETIRKVD